MPTMVTSVHVPVDRARGSETLYATCEGVARIAVYAVHGARKKGWLFFTELWNCDLYRSAIENLDMGGGNAVLYDTNNSCRQNIDMV